MPHKAKLYPLLKTRNPFILHHYSSRPGVGRVSSMARSVKDNSVPPSRISALWSVICLLVSDTPLFAPRWSDTTREASLTFDTGIIILRLGAAVSVISLQSTTLRHGDMPWLTWAVPYLVIAYVSLHLIAFIFAHGRDKALQLLDVFFATFILCVSRNTESLSAAFYLIPLLINAHESAVIQWSITSVVVPAIASSAVIYCGHHGGLVAGSHFSMQNAEATFALWSVALSRAAVLLVASIVLRLYRLSQCQARFFLHSLQEGTQCGIAVLSLDGHILHWNAKLQDGFAPARSRHLIGSRLPCYYVFHEQSRPCRWCVLAWTPTLDESGGHVLWQANGPEVWTIDAKDLCTKVHHGTNWTISNQLRSAQDEQDRLHLFHIYFGPQLDQRKQVVGVVEAITEITDSVLEMPFLGRWNDAGVSSQIPPIAVVSADHNRHVLAMNNAKWGRCQKALGQSVSKSALLNRPCFASYGRPDHTYCETCPVLESRKGNTSKIITNYPGTAMVTAVPLLGPSRDLPDVRAVFEFVDDISRLVAVNDEAQALISFNSKRDVIEAGARAFCRIAKADKCILLEYRRYDESFLLRREHGRPPVVIPVADVPIAEKALRCTMSVYVNDLSCIAECGPQLSRWSWLRSEVPSQLGPALFFPIISDGRPVAIGCVTRFAQGSLFDSEDGLYCRLFSQYFSSALGRTVELERRSMLMGAVKETADVLSVECAMGTLIESSRSLLPDDVSLMGFLRAPSASEVSISFQSGAGLLFEEERKQKHWQWDSSQFLKVADAVAATLSTRQPKLICGHVETALSDWEYLLGTTKSVYVLPLVYSNGDVLGYFIAQSPYEAEGDAFPRDLRRLLEDLAAFGSVLLGRCAVLRECMRAFVGHDLGACLKKARVLIPRLIPAKSEPSLESVNTHLGRLLDICVDALEVAYITWQIASGDRSAVKGLECIDILSLVNDAVSMAFVSLDEPPIAYSLPPASRKCLCVPKLVQACIRELLTNALKYRVENTPVLVKLCEDAECVYISVTNQGSIPEEMKERVFESLFRLPGQAKIAGTGLGLWQVRQLMEAHPKGGAAITDCSNSSVTVTLWLSRQCQCGEDS